MSYSMERYSKTLELDRILERLAAEATMRDAKELARSLAPQTAVDTVEGLLENTDEAISLVARYAAPSFGAAVNVSDSLARAKIGASLTIKELLDIAEVLRIVRSVKTWRKSCIGTETPSIEPLFSMLSPNQYLEERITSAIKSEDELNDHASPQLADLRRNIISKSGKIRESLEKIVHGNGAKYLQESIITQRAGRFVVPVKVEHRNEVKGIVHDTSATGSTLFVEPMSVVETNNEIRVLQVKEREEINRILAELSAAVAEFSESILTSYQALVELNLIFAKASLAYKMKAVRPKLNDRGFVCLKRARHPLISEKTVVPVTVSLGGEYDTLIITGPNTGGKTVTLKTLGLLSMMAMCGLMIPGDDGSEIAVFGKIFADIGDEQSIEHSLSTFSAHMVHIVSVLEECGDNSLVLFDELCAGTDPVEGAALAKAILMHLKERHVKTAATTHYAELKSYALDTAGVENASCEFDVETLKPTYRLIVGVPGRSNAFSISQRLGLDEAVISIARDQISDDEARFERIVERLEQARQSAEEEHREAAALRAQLSETKRRSELLEQELQYKQEKLMEQTREKAAGIIENARSRSAALLNELEEIKKQFQAENAAQLLEKARAGYKKSLRAMEDEANPIADVQTAGQTLSEPPQRGDAVIIASLGKDAEVLDVDLNKGRAFVISGSIKMWVDFGELRLRQNQKRSAETKKTRRITGVTSRAQRPVSGEIDLRGMASDEAILKLDRYIDNALLSGINIITIIHGKGTGTLRKAVHTHLRSHRSIKGFRVGTFGEGENGVTIAELND